MISFAAKIAIGLAATAICGSSIPGGYLLNWSQTIEEKLKAEGYRILDTAIVENGTDTDNQEWKTKISNNWENNELIMDKINMTEESKKIEALKISCKSVLGLSYESSDPNYEKASKYCAIKVSTEQRK